MSMSHLYSAWPFKLIRRKFSIIVSYAMTINKSRGQSLDGAAYLLTIYKSQNFIIVLFKTHILLNFMCIIVILQNLI